jgi:hypothetical protein
MWVRRFWYVAAAIVSVALVAFVARPESGQAIPSIDKALILATPSGEPPGNAMTLRIHYDPPAPNASPAVFPDEAVKTAETYLDPEGKAVVVEAQPVLAQYSKVSYQVDRNDNPTKTLTSQALVWVVRVVGPCFDPACAYLTNYVVVDAVTGQVLAAYPDQAQGNALPNPSPSLQTPLFQDQIVDGGSPVPT